MSKNLFLQALFLFSATEFKNEKLALLSYLNFLVYMLKIFLINIILGSCPFWPILTHRDFVTGMEG